MPPARAIGALRSFKCLGSDCPATCCQGWRVPVDDATTALWRTEGYEAEAEALWDLDDGSRILYLDDDSQCVLLTSDGLCGVQSRHGLGAIPHCCAVFPRELRRWPDGDEVTVTAGCPEAARLMLADDAALAWVPWSLTKLERPSPSRPARGIGAALAHALRMVQELAAVLLADRRYPLSHRLFQVAALCHEASEDGLCEDGDTWDLSRAWRTRVMAHGWRDRLAQELSRTPLSPEVALEWVDGALAPRLADSGTAALRVLREQILTGGPLYKRERVILARRLGARPAGIEHLFERHAIYHVRHHSTFEASNLLIWAQTLLLHTAAVRVFSLLHPDAPDELDDAPAWLRVVTDTAWRFARDIEHAARTRDKASVWLEPESLQSLGAMALLTAV
jgi:hypothetical protein